MITIAQTIDMVNTALLVVSESSRLDAELLLSAVLNIERSYLYSHADRVLTTDEHAAFVVLYQRRLTGEPIAYILGRQEFWSLSLDVTRDVLIPRPETELLVELALQCLSKKPIAVVADLGTGSGAVALALARERPEWTLFATDLSRPALVVAKRNATRLRLANVEFSCGSWCNALPEIKLDAIISNPPYVLEDDMHLAKHVAAFEPRMALISGVDGLNAIREIVVGSIEKLLPGGWLLLEHGCDQARQVAGLLDTYGFVDIATYQDLAGHDRVTVASQPSKTQ